MHLFYEKNETNIFFMKIHLFYNVIMLLIVCYFKIIYLEFGI